MQRQMTINAPSLMTNLLKDAAKVESIDYSAEFDNLYTRMENFWKLYNYGQMSADLVRYLTGLVKTAHQVQIKSIETTRKYTNDTYKDLKVIEFPVVLTKNHYSNFQNIHLCFSLKFKSKANNNNDLAGGIVTVNIFFAHWIRELNIVRYGDERPILRTTNTVDVYGYLDELLKHMPKEDLTEMENNLLYCKEKVILADGRDRRANNVANVVDAPKRFN